MDSNYQKNVRSSNLELLRIIAMLGIVFSHYHFYLGDLMGANPTSSMSVYHYSIGMGGKIGINTFMLITGYFMCIKDISLKKYIKLIAWVYFYNIIIQGTFMALGGIKIGFSSLLDIIFPFRTINMDCFVTDFMWFYLFIPFVSILIRNLTKEQHLRLTMLCLIMFIGYNTIPTFSTEMSPVTWFVVIMLVASYVRMHEPSVLNYSPLVWFGGALFLILCAIVSILLLGRHGQNPRLLFADGNSLLAFLIAFALFMTFIKMELPYNKWINLYGGAAFGVLLIHSNCWPMRELIFMKIFDTQYYFIEGNIWMPIVSCLSIYFVCGTIEIFRQKYLEQPMLNVLYKFFRIQ